MPIYHSLGKIPHKRHTIFKNGKDRYFYEQLFGTIGFDGMSTLSYHVHRPTMVKELRKPKDVTPKIAIEKNMRSLRLHGFKTKPEKDHLAARKTMLVNSDCAIVLAAPQAKSVDYFYKNADCDEMIFVHKGSGTLRTFLGNIDFKYGDYLMIPRGMIYTMEFKDSDNRCSSWRATAPCTRRSATATTSASCWSIRRSASATSVARRSWRRTMRRASFVIKVKKQNMLHELVYASHPFDVVGWDGYNYPYAFSIHDFEPITGRVHQPPPVHQTFETDAFVVCSFCPRLYDYHPQAIPAPYNHSNIDSDEVLYYVDGDFMSRNDIGPGHISLHPAGIPHGPHPGAMERSIGKKVTDELAVMVDTFKPLMVTEECLKIDDGKYYKSWLE
jgi:homogentisate 1,2-dioxygenase